ncbi:MAG: hypothetical protein ACLQJR_14845 [Stellaceae bacterium]
MTSNNEVLLRAILGVTARQAFPADRLTEIVSGGRAGKQSSAYNMCDGTKTLGDLASALKLDRGNFSRTVGRWIDEGVVFRLGEGRDAKLQHVYPLPDSLGKKKRSPVK